MFCLQRPLTFTQYWPSLHPEVRWSGGALLKIKFQAPNLKVSGVRFQEKEK